MPTEPHPTRDRVEPLAAPNVLVRGRHGLFVVNHNDLYIGRSLITYGEYSEPEVQLLCGILSQGDVVVEVGANIGVITVPLATAVGTGGRVVAIEPDPANARLLEANLALNGLDQALIHRGACGSRKAEARLPVIDRRAPGNFGGVSLLSDGAGEAVRVDLLDDLLAVGRLRLLKIDVEGMEGDVVAGARKTIERHQPYLYLENDRPRLSESLIEQVERLGYELWWHRPPLFNRANYFDHARDIFPHIHSTNMLGIPRDRTAQIRGLERARASEPHPSERERPNP